MIKYRTNAHLDIDTFKDLIKRTTLNRDLGDDAKVQRMLDNADFLYTAWDGDRVVGFIRGLTDYGDVVYVADLGIDQEYWRQGIGKSLLNLIDQELGTKMHVVLLASELAADYYAKVGFAKHPRGYIKSPK